MKPHPRIRKTVKWAGAAATVVLLVVWIGSAWFSVQWTSAQGTNFTHATSGIIAFNHLETSASVTSAILPGWSAERNRNPSLSLWWFHWGWDSSLTMMWTVAVPLWALATPILAATLLAWRLDALARRRQRGGKCAKCGYDKTGLPGGKDAVCPECGRGVSAASSESRA